MTFRVTHQSNVDGARSPFRIVEIQTGREVEWVNHFLDRECVRCLANTTLRSYAMDLLHFIRWRTSVNHTDAITENALASALPDYIRFPGEPTTTTCSRNHQSPRDRCRVCSTQCVSQCFLLSGSGLLPFLLVAFVTGHRPLPSSAQSALCEGTQAHTHASISGSGRSVLVRLSHRA